MQAEVETKHRLRAEAALAAARRLRPDSGEVHLALALHFSTISRYREEARAEIDLALHKLPDNTKVETLAGEIAYNQNRWDEATRFFERAAILDPHNKRVHGWLSNLYHSLRRYDDFDRECGQLIAGLAAKDFVALRLCRTLGPLEARADLMPLRTAINGVMPAEEPQVEVLDRYRLTLALCAHDPEAVTQVLATTTQTHLRISGVSYPKAWFGALAARMRHDEAGARAAFELARTEIDRAVQVDPVDGRILGLLAIIDAGLGDKDEAVREALHACELCPVETAADQAPVVGCDLAVVYAWTAQPDLACDVLEKWIARPAGFTLPVRPTYGDFRLNPCGILFGVVPALPHW